jgi:ABC-2 type transport system permease protein
MFRLSVRQLASRRRLLLVLLLAALPIGLVALVSAIGDEESSNEEFVNILLDGMLIAAILPIVTMVLATAAFGNELEDRTLGYLVMKPLSRLRIVIPKLLAPVVVGAPLLIGSGVVATLLGASGLGTVLLVLDGDVQAVLAVGVAVLAGVVTYAAIFLWAGLMTSRALAFALIYVFLWEGLISTYLGGIRYLSVRAYSLGILHGMDEGSFGSLDGRVIEFPAAIGGAVIVTVVFFLMTVRHLTRMDVP